MAARSVACPSCGRRAPSGRTDCPSCGAALAAIATTAVAVPDSSDAGAGAALVARSSNRRSKAVSLETSAAGGAADPADAVDAGEPTATQPPAVDERLAALVSAAASLRDGGADSERASDGGPDPAPARRPGAYLPPSTSSAGASRGPTFAVAASASRPFAASAPSGEAASIDVAPYVPSPPLMALAPAPAGAWTGPSAAVPASVSSAEELTPGRASLLADLPFDAPDDLPGWLVAVGSIGAAVSFLLPWAPEVLGSPAFGTTYFGQWGLASPMHLPPLLFIVAIAALAVLPNGVAAWIRTGILPVLAGGLLLGLTWPYLVGGFGGLLGTTIAAAAAILMVAGGVVALAPRHAEPAVR